MIVYINIGSNLGDRSVNIERALSAVSACYPILALSEPVESEPWGFSSDNSFINICAALEGGEQDPLRVLDKLQAIERSISPCSHRAADGSYIDRLIDIDIVAIDDMVLSTSRLTLPHPHLHDRPFFLNPYREVKEKLTAQR